MRNITEHLKHSSDTIAKLSFSPSFEMPLTVRIVAKEGFFHLVCRITSQSSSSYYNSSPRRKPQRAWKVDVPFELILEWFLILEEASVPVLPDHETVCDGAGYELELF